MQETAMYILQEVKTLLNLHDDNSRDTLLQSIINLVYGRLLARTGYKELPEGLFWILIEITCSRYNLLGSEGVHSELNEGIQYIYDRNLLAEYEEDLERFLQDNPPPNKRKFRML
jgi:hypothetical protein